MDISPQIIQFVSLLIELAIAAIIPTLTIAIYKWITAKAAEIQTKLTADQITQFRSIVAVTVQAAEQSGLAGLITNVGVAKKQYVIDALQAFVDARHWAIPIQQIESELEAAVHQGLEQVTTPPVAPAPQGTKTETTTTTTSGGTQNTAPGMGVTPPGGTAIAAPDMSVG